MVMISLGPSPSPPPPLPQTAEMTLRRNDLGQLGFHIHYEGVVSDVEKYGFAWHEGLRQGGRLVEICKVATATLTHDQMIDLLRTSVTVTVVVIAPFDNGTPRRSAGVCTIIILISGHPLISGRPRLLVAGGDYRVASSGRHFVR